LLYSLPFIYCQFVHDSHCSHYIHSVLPFRLHPVARSATSSGSLVEMGHATSASPAATPNSSYPTPALPLELHLYRPISCQKGYAPSACTSTSASTSASPLQTRDPATQCDGSIHQLQPLIKPLTDRPSPLTGGALRPAVPLPQLFRIRIRIQTCANQ